MTKYEILISQPVWIIEAMTHDGIAAIFEKKNGFKDGELQTIAKSIVAMGED